MKMRLCEICLLMGNKATPTERYLRMKGGPAGQAISVDACALHIAELQALKPSRVQMQRISGDVLAAMSVRLENARREAGLKGRALPSVLAMSEASVDEWRTPGASLADILGLRLGPRPRPVEQV